MKHLIAILVSCAFLTPAFSSDEDHDRAMRALRDGEVMPLSEILSFVQREVGGRVIEVDFERDDGRWIYELELLSPDGRIMELEIDGATGRILKQEFDD